MPGSIDAGGTRKIINYGHTTEDFGGWYKTLPEKEQVRVVGEVRQKLLKEGKIDFSQLVNRNTGALHSLRDLGFNERGKPLEFQEVIANIRNGGQPVFTRHMAGYLNSLDTESATKKAGEFFSTAFPAWSKSPDGTLPLVVLDENTAAEIGSKSKIGLLSSFTMSKQMDHHPELTQRDYERVQEIVKNGESYKQKAYHYAFIDKKAEAVVIIKPTISKEELYVQSVYKLSTNPGRRDSEIRRLKKGKQG